MRDDWDCSPPDQAFIEQLTRDAGDVGEALVALDARLRDPAVPAEVRRGELLDCFDASEKGSSADQRLRYNFCAIWGIEPMIVGPGHRVEAFPRAWIEAGGDEPSGTIARLVTRGLISRAGMVIRPAVVEIECAKTPHPDVGVAGQLLDLLGSFYNQHSAPEAETRELKQRLVSLTETQPSSDEWIGLVDAVQSFIVGAPELDRTSLLCLQLCRLIGSARERLAADDVVLVPELAQACDARDLDARPLAADAETESVYADDVPAGAVAFVSRFGVRRGGATERPARLAISRGPRPPLVALGEAVIAELEAIGASSESARQRTLDLTRSHDSDDLEARVRPVIGLVNAVDQAVGEVESPGLGDLSRRIVGELMRLGVTEVEIRTGEPFDRYPPDLYNVRRAQSPTARSGEILQVIRRAFNGPDGRLLQQATIEVNLGE